MINLNPLISHRVKVSLKRTTAHNLARTDLKKQTVRLVRMDLRRTALTKMITRVVSIKALIRDLTRMAVKDATT